ncbi:MAG: hypothetical protein JSV88_27055 [Candidatus Aminicenantes bacterium]|nr:MAG: hypothetical protein JSV88_27055 [Candidatus Aminicenantes bacterium]
MIDKIKESDWKYLKKLKPALLERACANINKEAKLILENKENRDQYQVYMAIYDHYQKKDDIIDVCFNDYRRSTAKQKILNLFKYGILSELELQGFSDDTKEFVEIMRKHL